jgi:hypothetical protein
MGFRAVKEGPRLVVPLFTSHGLLRVLRVSVVKRFRRFYHHGATENTENALIESQIRSPLRGSTGRAAGRHCGRSIDYCDARNHLPFVIRVSIFIPDHRLSPSLPVSDLFLTHNFIASLTCVVGSIARISRTAKMTPQKTISDCFVERSLWSAG